MHFSYRGIQDSFSDHGTQEVVNPATTDHSIVLTYRGVAYALISKIIEHPATGIPSAAVPLCYRGVHYLSERFTPHVMDHESLESGSDSTEQE